MENNQIHLIRSGILITSKCTLKCRLCAAFVPYYEKQCDVDFDELSKTIDIYFSVVDTVGDFSIAGGEPLLHGELDRILLKVLEYAEQIQKVLILTNGTLLLKDTTLDILRNNRDKCQITISDYGRLSAKANELAMVLETNDIPSRIIKYYGEDAYCNGWVDYNDCTLKYFTQNEIDRHAASCARFMQGGGCPWIVYGKMYVCGRSDEFSRRGIVPINNYEYIDLLDNSTDVTEKKNHVKKMLNLKSLSACAYCDGLTSYAKRYPPAEQL